MVYEYCLNQVGLICIIISHPPTPVTSMPHQKGVLCRNIPTGISAVTAMLLPSGEATPAVLMWTVHLQTWWIQVRSWCLSKKAQDEVSYWYIIMQGQQQKERKSCRLALLCYTTQPLCRRIKFKALEFQGSMTLVVWTGRSVYLCVSCCIMPCLFVSPPSISVLTTTM